MIEYEHKREASTTIQPAAVRYGAHYRIVRQAIGIDESDGLLR